MTTHNARRPGLTLAILAIASISYVLQQTLVVPAIPTIQQDLHTTNTWATWVFTGFLLTSSIATPLLGKLGDMYGKKRLLAVAMAVFVVGLVGAALATSITWLILARALQGSAGAVFPLAFGIVRDEFPAEKVGVSLGLLSATFGVGGGLGLVLSGLILDHLSWQWLFWLGAIPSVVALVLVLLLIPESPVRTRARLDWKGALALSAALAALLVALSEGANWGWTSPTTLGVFALAAAASVVWVLVELKVAEPMIDIGLMRDRAVFWTNMAAVFTGFSLFGTFLLVPTFVQMGRGLPPELQAMVPYGFQSSVIVAGLFLLPASAIMLVVGPLGGIIERRTGAKPLVMTGMLLLGIGALVIAAMHSTGWQIVLSMVFVGIGVGLVYAMLAKLIIDSVQPEVTGVAMGMNTVMRTIGGVIGGQVGAAILSANVVPGSPGLPAEQGFTITFALAGVVAIVGAFGCLRIPSRAKRVIEVAPAS